MCRWLSPLILLSVLGAGCGGEATFTSAPSAPGDVQQAREAVQAVAAVYPLNWVATRVALDADVNLLTQGSQEAHAIELTPPQRAAIETADVVLYMGDIAYQPQVEQAIPAAQGQVVDAAEVAGDDVLAASGDAHAHEDAADTHSDDAGDDHAGQESGVDPHLWFDPGIMAEVAVAVGQAFAAADPDNTEAYRHNAAAVGDEMTAVGADLDALLGADCRFDEAIVSHAAYAYLLEPYGKTQHAVTNISAEDDASAGELAEIVGEIEEEGFTHVLVEPVEGREGAEAVAREAGVELLEIAPLDAVTDDQAARGLPDLVRAQAEAFATALGCR